MSLSGAAAFHSAARAGTSISSTAAASQRCGAGDHEDAQRIVRQVEEQRLTLTHRQRRGFLPTRRRRARCVHAARRRRSGVRIGDVIELGDLLGRKQRHAPRVSSEIDHDRRVPGGRRSVETAAPGTPSFCGPTADTSATAGEAARPTRFPASQPAIHVALRRFPERERADHVRARSGCRFRSCQRSGYLARRQ